VIIHGCHSAGQPQNEAYPHDQKAEIEVVHPGFPEPRHHSSCRTRSDPSAAIDEFPDLRNHRDPSPAAEATRFTEPLRTSPTAKMRGREAAKDEWAPTSAPVSTKPLVVELDQIRPGASEHVAATAFASALPSSREL